MTETGTNITNFRANIADRIKALSQRWAQNTVALGGEFRRARDSFPVKGNKQQASRPGWHQWLKAETGWSVQHVNTLIRINEKFGGRDIPALSYKVLEYLSRGVVPDEGAEAVIERAEKGDRVGLDKAKEIVQKSRPSPNQARIEAREKGKLVLASDGNLYSGATKDEAAAYSARRSQTYAIRDAIAAISGCGVTPTQWLAQADAPWIKDMTPAEIKRAIAWLTKLEGRYGHD